MMKKYMYVLPILFGVFMMMACGESGERKQRVVTVSIEPLRYLVERIAGDSVEVVSMVTSGSSPETYEPTPRQLMDLHNSMAYLYVGGLGFERLWTERLQENAPGTTFAGTADGVNYIQTKHDGHIEEDPHVWMSIPNMRTMAHNVLRTLMEVEPAYSNGYQRRYRELNASLDSLERVIETIRADADSTEKPVFLIYHPALTYMARDYGWEQVCIEENGKEPSPTRLRSIIRRGKETNVRLIFLQQEFDQKNIESIARELNLSTFAISPLSYNWPEEMVRIARAIYKKGGKE